MSTETAAFSAPPRRLSELPGWFRETRGSNVFVLRAFFAVTFVFAGLQKLANPAFFKATNPTGIHEQIRSAQGFSPIGGLLGPALHVSTLVGVIIALGEVAVGLGTLVGFRTRVAAVGGMLLSLSFFLTVSWNTSPYYYGADIVFLFAWTTILLAGPSGFSLDAWLAERRLRASAPPPGTPGRQAAKAADGPDTMERRAAVQRLGVTAALGAVVLALGGVTAALGRAVGKGSKAVAGTDGGSTGSGGSGGNSGSGGGPTTTTPKVSGTPKGKLIGPAAAVPVASAKPFTNAGQPAYALQPKQGVFLGFSRICTHEGCTVNYVGSVQQFQCPCHGSVYSATTGEVLSGPAPLPLPKIGIVESTDGNLYATD